MLPNIPVLEPPHIETIAIIRPAEEKPKPKKQYIIKEGDTLTKIAKVQSVDLSRLWAANPQLTNPDLIEPEKPLNVPDDNEKLKPRPFPATVEISTSPPQNQTSAPSGRSSISGRFQWGWCTFFADQQRPDIGATGNAADWIRYANSSTPQKGAVAVNTSGLGHVAIVLDFNGSQVLVKHMNWAGFGEVSEDWIDYSYWSGYIL